MEAFLFFLFLLFCLFQTAFLFYNYLFFFFFLYLFFYILYFLFFYLIIDFVLVNILWLVFIDTIFWNVPIWFFYLNLNVFHYFNYVGSWWFLWFYRILSINILILQFLHFIIFLDIFYYLLLNLNIWILYFRHIDCRLLNHGVNLNLVLLLLILNNNII